MLTRRTFIKIAIFAALAVPYYQFFGKRALWRLSAWTGRHQHLEALLAKGFGPFADRSVLEPFIKFVGSEHPELLRDDYDDKAILARNVTALFIVNSNLPESGFNIASYQFEKRGPYCNPFAVTDA